MTELPGFRLCYEGFSYLKIRYYWWGIYDKSKKHFVPTEHIVNAYTIIIIIKWFYFLSLGSLFTLDSLILKQQQKWNEQNIKLTDLTYTICTYLQWCAPWYWRARRLPAGTNTFRRLPRPPSWWGGWRWAAGQSCAGKTSARRCCRAGRCSRSSERGKRNEKNVEIVDASPELSVYLLRCFIRDHQKVKECLLGFAFRWVTRPLDTCLSRGKNPTGVWPKPQSSGQEKAKTRVSIGRKPNTRQLFYMLSNWRSKREAVPR